MDVESAVPSAPTTRRFKQTLAVLVGVAAVTAALMSYIEIDQGRKEDRAFVKASRSALEIFVKLAASNPHAQFEANAVRATIVVDAQGTARVIGAPRGEALDHALALAEAQSRASKRLQIVAQSMSALPDRPGKVDRAALEAIGADLGEVSQIAVEQNRFVDDANKYGTRQQRSFFALGLTATAAALLGLAALMGAGRAGNIGLRTAAGALAVAIVVGLSGFIV